MSTRPPPYYPTPSAADPLGQGETPAVGRITLADPYYDPRDILVASAEVRGLRVRVAELELALSLGQQKAWLVERQLWEGSDTFYMWVESGRVKWTNRRDDALRFARREDAAAFMSTTCDSLRLQATMKVAEHVWS